MKRLIDFITVMPGESAEHKRGHKYPFLALEIFNCEINPLLEKFFEAPEPKETSSAAATADKDMKDDEVIMDNDAESSQPVL